MSIKAKETAKKCSKLYLEGYTGYCKSVKELEKLLGKKITKLSRKDVEDYSKKLISKAKKNNIGILIQGHALCATTHIALLQECKEHKISYQVIHGSSVFTAVSVTGLSMYNFGKVTSIPFDNHNVKEPYNVLLQNNNLHTLFLLDLKDGKFMNFKDAISYLLRMDKTLANKIAVICGALGSNNERIIAGKMGELLSKELEVYPQVLIIPGKMQFYEEEFLASFS
ncbi:MAG: diphthine synthase [Nanoarchaeota archaeon]